MKSNVCKIENGIRNLEAILQESENVANYNGLNQNQALQLRLLCEEIDGMLPKIIGDFDGEFWIEYENGICGCNEVFNMSLGRRFFFASFSLN